MKKGRSVVNNQSDVSSYYIDRGGKTYDPETPFRAAVWIICDQNGAENKVNDRATAQIMPKMLGDGWSGSLL